LSGDQLQEGPVRRIRCDRPMSTVQHLWTLSASPTPRGVIVAPLRLFPARTQREERARREKHVSFSFRSDADAAVGVASGTGNCRFSAERNRRVARERASIKLRRDDRCRSGRSIDRNRRGISVPHRVPISSLLAATIDSQARDCVSIVLGAIHSGIHSPGIVVTCERTTIMIQ